MERQRGRVLKNECFLRLFLMALLYFLVGDRLCCVDNAEIIRQKQLVQRWQRQRKIFLVEYLSILPAKFFSGLLAPNYLIFYDSSCTKHPSVAPLQTEFGISINRIV